MSDYIEKLSFAPAPEHVVERLTPEQRDLYERTRRQAKAALMRLLKVNLSLNDFARNPCGDTARDLSLDVAEFEAAAGALTSDDGAHD